MTTTKNTIIYASDLNEDMPPVFNLAMNLAGKYDARLIFLNVIEPIDSAVYHRMSKEMWDDIKDKAHGHATDLAEKVIESFMAENKKVTRRPELKVVHGNVTQSIIGVADEYDANYIVLGSRGHSALGGFLLGSVADKVSRLSQRAVVLVPTGQS